MMSGGQIVDLGDDEPYLSRGSAWIGTSNVSRADMMANFGLDVPLRDMSEASLPDGHRHLLRGLGLSNANADIISKYNSNVSLLAIADTNPYEKPIEQIPDHIISAGFQFPTTIPSVGAVYNKAKTNGTTNGLVTAPPATIVGDATALELAERQKKEAKREKKRKREREEAEKLKPVLSMLHQELKAISWKTWPINNKPGNPFIEKYTRENCKSLNVPNYFDYISTPMDLTRMGEKLQRMEYVDLSLFSQDVALIVNNAKIFNPIGTPVHDMALEFEKHYQQRLDYYIQQGIIDPEGSKKKKKKEKKKKKDKKKET